MSYNRYCNIFFQTSYFSQSTDLHTDVQPENDEDEEKDTLRQKCRELKVSQYQFVGSSQNAFNTSTSRQT